MSAGCSSPGTANDRRPRLLTLHAGALGDLILTLHLLDRLRAACPWRITLVARSSWCLWAARQGRVDEGRLSDALGLHALHAESSTVPEALADELRSFDHVLSLFGSPDAPVSARLRDIVGSRRLTCIDPRPSDETLEIGRHIVEQWLQDAAALSAPSQVVVGAGEVADAGLSRTCPDVQTRASRAESPPLVIVHPGSGGLAKCAPLETLEDLVDRLNARDWGACWMIGPDEMERFGPSYADRLSRTARVIVEEAPAGAAEAVAPASAYVGMDAGMTHVAALLGVPTLAVFGPTDACVWRPLGPRVRTLTIADDAWHDEAWIELALAEIEALGADRSAGRG